MFFINYIAWLIVFCEISFWIVIILGLIIRYILRLKKLGFLILALTPVIDLLLLIVTTIDLLNGAKAELPHAIAAVYISISLVFGKSMIKWFDDKFRYYIMRQGNKPNKLTGYDYSIYYAKTWLKHLLSYIIGMSLLFLIKILVNNNDKTEALNGVIHGWSIIIIIDLIICITYFIWPPKEK